MSGDREQPVEPGQVWREIKSGQRAEVANITLLGIFLKLDRTHFLAMSEAELRKRYTLEKP
jgi:hypothetical protein